MKVAWEFKIDAKLQALGLVPYDLLALFVFWSLPFGPFQGKLTVDLAVLLD